MLGGLGGDLGWPVLVDNGPDGGVCKETDGITTSYFVKNLLLGVSRTDACPRDCRD